MTINKKQKRTITIGLLLISATFIIWLYSGGEVFTKTQVLIEKSDELLGVTYKVWKDKFVLGLDYTFGFGVIIFLLSGINFWIQRSKKN